MTQTSTHPCCTTPANTNQSAQTCACCPQCNCAPCNCGPDCTCATDSTEQS